MHQVGLLLLLALAFIGSVVGCATASSHTATEGDRVSLASYSIVVPSNRGWHIEQLDQSRDTIHLQKDHGRYFMYIGKQIVTNQTMRSWSAQEVADDYRASERQNMLVQGAGIYRLIDLRQGRTIIAGKTFYTMDYGKDITEHGLQTSEALYLYFPQQSEIDSFYVMLYVEASDKHAAVINSDRDEFLQTLRSFSPH